MGDPVYDEWYALIEDEGDRIMINAMVGLNDNCNRLRQSPPDVGMSPKAVAKKFNEEIAS